MLGLDLSLTGAGLCALDEHGTVLIAKTVGYTLSKGSRVKERVERQINIASAIIRLCREYKVTHVATEHYAFAQRSGRQQDLAELRGVVHSQLWLAVHLEPSLAVASAARKEVLGSGNIKKAMIRPTLEKRLGEVFPDHNAADAYVVAEWLRRQVLNAPAVGPRQQELGL